MEMDERKSRIFDTLGQRLKYLRGKKRLQQKDVAECLNIGRSTYNQYEADKRTPDAEMLAKFCEFFNTSADFLLGLTDDPRPVKEREEEVKILVEAHHRKEDPVSALPEDAKKSLYEFIRKMAQKYGDQ